MSVDNGALVDAVRRRLVDGGGRPTRARLAEAITDAGLHGGAAVLEAAGIVGDSMLGLGPLTALIADADVTDVLVNGHDDIWCDGTRGLHKIPLRFDDDDAVRRLAVRLVAQGGRRLDDAQPYADVRLHDGSRLSVVLPPVSADRTVIALRVARDRALQLSDLVALDTVTAAGAGLLTALVTARLSFVVSGGTGSGKTTLLSALLGTADHSERVVIVEDVRELRPTLPHVVHLCTREANAEGAGAVGLADLVRQTLRLRPDRIVVGEVRGGEVVDLLRALNSGHEGGCTTIHANTADDVPARVEALALCAGLRREAAHSLLAAAFDVVVHVSRDGDGQRRIRAISLLRRRSDGLVVAIPAVTFPPPAREPQLLPAGDELLELLATRGVVISC